MQSAITVDHLSVRYRSKGANKLEAAVNAVNDLSFQVEPGEIVGFLGPNGAGKSSTLKAMMGFVTPSGGQSKIFGFDAGSPGAHAQTGYLPEVALYYPYLTPLETLSLYGRLQGLGGSSLRKESELLLERLGLAGAMRKQNRTLSKGMLQRVGIAQSLLGSPRLLVLDEVTSGLDPSGRKELREILKEQQRKGATLFFSSHELSEVDLLCDRILLISHGQLVEERGVGELKASVREYELRFKGVADLTGLAHDLTTDSQHQLARFKHQHEMIEALARIQSSGGTVIEVVARDGSLEDYFIETIRRAA